MVSSITKPLTQYFDTDTIAAPSPRAARTTKAAGPTKGFASINAVPEEKTVPVGLKSKKCQPPKVVEKLDVDMDDNGLEGEQI